MVKSSVEVFELHNSSDENATIVRLRRPRPEAITGKRRRIIISIIFADDLEKLEKEAETAFITGNDVYAHLTVWECYEGVI